MALIMAPGQYYASKSVRMCPCRCAMRSLAIGGAVPKSSIGPGGRRVRSAQLETIVRSVDTKSHQDCTNFSGFVESVAGNEEFEQFVALTDGRTKNLVPLYTRIMGDQLTPITAYRCLVKEDDREAPSFLFESVVNGTQQGRYSFVGAHPTVEIVAKGHTVDVLNHGTSERKHYSDYKDPLEIPEKLSENWRVAVPEDLPRVFTGGWVGYCGYDTVRYVYEGKLPFESAPTDDRNLPDMHLALYTDTVLFDHATKLAYVVTWVNTDEYSTLEEAFAAGKDRLNATNRQLEDYCVSGTHMSFGKVDLSLKQRPKRPENSNFTESAFMEAIGAIKEHILSGDVFQLVLSQRFERSTFADPFEIYRALRVVNPSPYMAYLQTRGSILVSSSPEILCRVEESTKQDEVSKTHKRIVTNRPLAGTRRRGATQEEDLALEEDLLQDEKELAEHVMLVDLGRNDVGRVAQAGTVNVEKLMQIERYSHVMHISSTVTGVLKPELSCWDALRAALPAGTVSGAPKVRAMQILDELENSKRGPYGGGFGHVSFTGSMDMALALRTMVIPTGSHTSLYKYENGTKTRREWTVHLQAGAGVVADSVPASEFEETVNKAAALGRAIDLAESSFVGEQ